MIRPAVCSAADPRLSGQKTTFKSAGDHEPERFIIFEAGCRVPGAGAE